MSWLLPILKTARLNLRGGHDRALAEAAIHATGVSQNLSPGSRLTVLMSDRGFTLPMGTQEKIILNRDDAGLASLLPTLKGAVLTYGQHPESNITLTRWHPLPAGGLVAEIKINQQKYEFNNRRLLTSNQLRALLPAIAIGHHLKHNLADLMCQLESFELPSGELRGEPGPHGSWLLHRSLDADPESVLADLEALQRQPAERRFLMLGDLSEINPGHTGIYSEISYQAGHIADSVILVGKHSENMSPGLRAADVDTHHFLDPHSAAIWLKQFLRHNDTVFITGGAHMNMPAAVQHLR